MQTLHSSRTLRRSLCWISHKANVVSRVVVTPNQAKKILGALGNNIAQYENKFGTIKPVGGPVPGSTISVPFTGGEA